MTIKELARLANTSAAAVSLVLNGKWHKKVAPATVEKVQRLVQEHHFRLNMAGKSLVMQRHFRVAVCAESALIDHALMGAYSFHEQLGIISAQLSKQMYAIDMVRLDESDEPEKLRFRLGSRCDGVIFLGMAAPRVRKLLRQQRMDMPYVAVDSNLRDKSLNYVFTNMAASSRNVVDKLIERGHKHIALVRGESLDRRFAEKLKGYRRSLDIHHLPYEPALVIGGYAEDFFVQGYEAAGQLWQLRKRPTAVFCTDNCSALGFIQAAHTMGVVVPAAVEVVGFGDEAISLFSRPRLTFVNRPVKEMAQKAVELLLAWIEGKTDYQPLQMQFEEKLVVQGTAFCDQKP